MSQNPLAAFGHWIAQSPDNWPAAAYDAAQMQFVDLIAAAMAGIGEEAVRIVRSAVSDWGDGPCAVFGIDQGLAPPWAALVNGTAAHALDFDDNFDPAKAHASAVLVPALLALADYRGASGRHVLDAYIVGLQIMGRVGQGMNPYHRNRGWHATATVGAIGAAAACARLLQLPADQAAHALSLSTSMASGSMAQFGTMAKPLHAGLAASSGIKAASLAAAGLTAGSHTLDGPHGINRLMVGQDYASLRDNLDHIEHGQTMRFETENVGEPLQILHNGFRVKRFANCGSAHRAMDGLLLLREKHGFAAGDVQTVTVRAPASHLANLRYTAPKTVLEAKFSLEFALALILQKGACDLADFSDAMVADQRLRDLYPVIRRDPVDAAEGQFPTEVHVVLRDGSAFHTSISVPQGSRTAPFSKEIYWGKLLSCLQYAGLAAQFEPLKSALTDLPEMADIGGLTALLRAAPSN